VPFFRPGRQRLGHGGFDLGTLFAQQRVVRDHRARDHQNAEHDEYEQVNVHHFLMPDPKEHGVPIVVVGYYG